MKQAKIIAVANQKGGSGKSFITTISAAYTNTKHKVLVICIDDYQKTMHIYYNKDLKNGYKENELLTLISVDATKTLKAIEQNINDYDYIFIDIPGNLKKDGVISTLTVVDIILIPTALSDEDQESTLIFIDLLKEKILPLREKHGYKTTVYGILNQEYRKSLEYKKFKRKNPFGIDFFNTVIPHSRPLVRKASTKELIEHNQEQLDMTNFYNELHVKLGL